MNNMTLEQACAEAQAQMTPHLMRGIPSALFLRVMAALCPLDLRRRAHSFFFSAQERAEMERESDDWNHKVPVDYYDYDRVCALRVRLQELQEVVSDCTGGAVQLPLASAVAEALQQQLDEIGALRRARANRQPRPYRHQLSKYRLTYRSVTVTIPPRCLQDLLECDAADDLLPFNWERDVKPDGSCVVRANASCAMRIKRWFPRHERGMIRITDVTCDLSRSKTAPRLP